ncbi:hypothetical protein ACM66B_003045 [Microbotryomycetes sp. NB124-2]
MSKRTRQQSDDDAEPGFAAERRVTRSNGDATRKYGKKHKNTHTKAVPVVQVPTRRATSFRASSTAPVSRRKEPTPQPAPVDERDSDSDNSEAEQDEVAQMLTRTRSGATPSVSSTPTKAKARAMQKTTPKRSSRQVPTPPKSAQAPPKTPTKTRSPTKGRASSSVRDEPDILPRTPSPHKQQQQQQQARATPVSRSGKSDRQRGLPPDLSVLKIAPPLLISRLVGAHMDLPDYRVPTQAPTEATQEDDEDESDADELEVEGRPADANAPATVKSRKSKTEQLRHTEPVSASNVMSMLASVTSVLTGATPPALEAPQDCPDIMDWPYLDDQYRKWEQPMRYAARSVIESGTGNCLMLIGPRGVGKTMIAERCLSILDHVYGRDRYIPVRLNGLVHTTDRMALRSIAWQLKTQGFEEFEGDWSSNAATMTTLLRMLEPASDSNSVAEKPVIIVLDEFDLFALHPRQSFLYCLLDIVQGNRRKAGMGVIGLSSRVDCLAILEKRVRSRCQSQVHHMVLSNNFADYVKLAKSLISVEAAADADDNQRALTKEWNAEIESFIDDNAVQDYLRRQWFTFGNTPTQLRLVLAHVIYRIEAHARKALTTDASAATFVLPTLDVTDLPAEAAAASREDLALDRLSILELTVCVAAKHMRTTHDNTFNLEMLYRCYCEHAGRRKIHVTTKTFSRSAFIMAFDRLRAQQLFLPHLGKLSSHVSPSEANPHKTFRFVPWDTTIDEALRRRSETKKDVPEQLKKWCKDWTA